MNVEKPSFFMGNRFWSWQEWRMVCWEMPWKVCMWKRRKEKKQKNKTNAHITRGWRRGGLSEEGEPARGEGGGEDP